MMESSSMLDEISRGTIKEYVDRISSAILRGVSHEGRLIGREACNQEQEGNRDTRVREVQAISMT